MTNSVRVPWYEQAARVHIRCAKNIISVWYSAESVINIFITRLSFIRPDTVQSARLIRPLTLSSYTVRQLNSNAIGQAPYRASIWPDMAPYQVWRLQPKLPKSYIRLLSFSLAELTSLLNRPLYLYGLAGLQLGWVVSKLMFLVINWTLNKLQLLI